MKERALLIGATLEIGETPSGGLSVTVRLPGQPPEPDITPSGVFQEKVTA
jgi:nitrate/nitrite-specific signal transduction histidine kinase